MKTVARGAALVAVLLAIVTVRVVWSSRAEWKQAGAAPAGDERVAHLGRAARLYAPGNPWSRRALDELAQLGRDGQRACGESRVEGRGSRVESGGERKIDCDGALAAWREVRSAILATRSFYTPRRALLDEANGAIAALMADADDPARGSPDARRAWHAARLAWDDAPSVGWSVAALLGLALWVGSAVGFFVRGVDERDKLRRRPALVCALGVALGLILFFVGLGRA